ncbi:hypothetical protein C8255_01705 [filamentous cyanobacterium CCP3]|nr:hypothetical protein C8255_01705 [filamentous cyanobacterium CCP3]
MKPPVTPIAPSGLSSQSATLTSLQDSSFQRWYGEGERLANAGAYERALRCFEEAAIVDPQAVSALIYQAVCLIHLGQPKQGLALTEQVLAIAPDHAQGWLFRGVALHRVGRYPEAYRCYAQVSHSH